MLHIEIGASSFAKFDSEFGEHALAHVAMCGVAILTALRTITFFNLNIRLLTQEMPVPQALPRVRQDTEFLNHICNFVLNDGATCLANCAQGSAINFVETGGS